MRYKVVVVKEWEHGKDYMVLAKALGYKKIFFLMESSFDKMVDDVFYIESSVISFHPEKERIEWEALRPLRRKPPQRISYVGNIQKVTAVELMKYLL